MSSTPRTAATTNGMPIVAHPAEVVAHVEAIYTAGQLGYISPYPGRPCLICAPGRLTWLDKDGTCRRSDSHR